MNQALIDNWNRVVPKNGIVIHCGDFTLLHYSDKHNNEYYVNEYLKLMSKLNGRILLLRGNHDIIPIVEESKGNLIAAVDKAMVIVDGVKIYTEHYPCTAFNGDFQAFGHIHTLSDGTCLGSDADVPSRLSRKQYDVGVDQNNYTPVSYWELCDIFRKKLNNV